jgi:plastocyanin
VRRRLATACALALVPALAAAAVASAGSRRAPSRLMVSAQEHSFVLSRKTIKAGPALIQFLNRGEDPHDLRLRRVSGRGVTARRTLAVPETPSGDLAELEARLPAGRYKLWCSLPGHAQLGMRATLRVRRAR